MKKVFLVIILILIFKPSFGQTKIEGTFCSNDNWNWYCMKFYSDSLFVSSTWACGGGGESKGVYKIKDKILTLTYVSVDTLKNYFTDKINCDSLHRNHFNNLQFKFKKGDTETYKIKKYNSKKIILNQGRYYFPKDRKE